MCALPPIPADVAPIALDGPWRYAPFVPEGAPAVSLDSDQVLHVPGEAAMQGLPLDPAVPAIAERDIEIPRQWAGHRVRLRFDGVYSTAEVFVNGKPAGAHLGGFTAFDLDIMDLAVPGERARITVIFTNDSLADQISHGTRYANHPLAGIPRKVRLYALPPVHLTELRIDAGLEGTAGTLQVSGALAGAETAQVSARLIAPDETVIPLPAVEADNGRLTLSQRVPDALSWDHEHPRLYTLELVLDGETTYRRRIGFRTLEWDGRQLRLNGHRLLLKGVNRHEVHPKTGRADTARYAHTDVALFRKAHVNFIRTAHYPPCEELAAACDELGMLLEVELPICFAFGQFERTPRWEDHDAETQAAICDLTEQAARETLAMFANHPSVILWSIGNESIWAPPFERASTVLRAEDPTRPLTYNWYLLSDEDRPFADIANSHYPEAGKVGAFESEPRPVLFDEFAHLYCYNDHELHTDPGLRLHWGPFLERQWQEIRALPNGLGGSLWAGIDEVFHLPDEQSGDRIGGYGAWGVIDGWRRPKPEYAAVRRIFSPVWLVDVPLRDADGVTFKVENRWDMADLAEMDVRWVAGDASGVLNVSGAPGETRNVTVPHTKLDDDVWLVFRGPSAEDEVALLAPAEAAPQHFGAPVEVTAVQDSQTGLLDLGGVVTGPTLALVPRHLSRVHFPRTEPELLPLDRLCSAWRVDEKVSSLTRYRIAGGYAEAYGVFEIVQDRKWFSITYRFTLKRPIPIWQIGLVFTLPRRCDTLVWRTPARPGIQPPPDDPARPTGRATAFPDACESWAAQATEQGSRDFRSTRRGPLATALVDQSGSGVMVDCAAGQSVRAAIHGDAVRLFVLDHAGLGSESFLETFQPHRQLWPGDEVSGTARLALVEGAAS